MTEAYKCDGCGKYVDEASRLVQVALTAPPTELMFNGEFRFYYPQDKKTTPDLCNDCIIVYLGLALDILRNEL